MPLPDGIAGNVQVASVKPSVLHRFIAECQLAQSVQAGDVVLCFGNLPPLFKLKGRAVVFVQNRYLIDDVNLSSFPFILRLRLTLERLWLSHKMKHADEFIVQTPTMKKLMEKKTKGEIPVHVLPFVAEPDGYSRKASLPVKSGKNDFVFFYVASGEPYKNHRKLIEAWRLLADDGLFPLLKLTLDRRHFPELGAWIEKMAQEHRLKIENVENASHDEIKQLYRQSDALIYPSTFESFGLPLIEARQAGLPVLASELDYVRDVVDPEETFDPKTALSIARAVKRFLKVEEIPLPLQTAKEFLGRISDRDK
jgi:glycosyltransferase involved in cell wall biosynthesis